MLKINRLITAMLAVPFLFFFLLLATIASPMQSWAKQNGVQYASAIADLGDLRVSEIMYHPITDTAYASNEYEFIELANSGNSTIDISGVSVSDGITYTFAAGTVMTANSTLVLAKNPTAFQARYGFAPHNTATYLGQLRNEGETIRLFDGGGNLLFTIRYDNDEPLLTAAEGFGFSLEATGTPVMPNVYEEWRISSAPNGTPGALPTASNQPVVLVNEVLAHTDLPQIDFIELYNAKNETVDVGNWVITDNLTDLARFVVPVGTVIQPYGYLTFDQNELGFAFNSEGDIAYLFARDAQGALTGHAHGFSFGTSPNGISFGRCTLPASDGIAEDDEFVLQNIETIGAANALPQVGPVVISELMYNGPGTDAAEEFIELTNISSNPVPLYDPASPANMWRIDGIGPFIMPAGTSIPGNGTILIVRADPVTFRNTYNIPNTIAVLGPYEPSALNNDGERVSLQKPDEQNLDGTVPYYEVDGVRYNDALPWPLNADGLGKSLERVRVAEYGDSVLNWVESAVVGGTPGTLSSSQQSTSGNTNNSIFLPIISNGQNVVAAQQMSVPALMPQDAPCFSR